MNNNAYIGLALSDGSVSYIAVQYDGIFEMAGMKLKNFYKSEKRVKALFALGSLRTLGSTPYGGWNPESPSYDKVHCCAFIRDLGCKPKTHTAQKVQSKEAFFLLGGWTYLFENGGWTLGYKGTLYPISNPNFMVFKEEKPATLPLPPDLRAYSINESGSPERLYGFTDGWDTWKSMERKAGEKAEERQKSVYLFRRNKLVKSIHPKTYEP